MTTDEEEKKKVRKNGETGEGTRGTDQAAAQDNEIKRDEEQQKPSNSETALNRPVKPRRPRPVQPSNQYASVAQVGAPLRAQLELAAAAAALQPPAGRASVSPPKRPTCLPARFHGRLAGAAPMSLGANVASSPSSGDKPNRYSWAQMQQWHARQQQQRAAAAAAAASVDPTAGHPGGLGADIHMAPDFHYHFPSPFTSAASRVLYVNPIVNLSNFEHTKSRLIKFIEVLKRLSEKWFSHVLLLLFLAVYACLGAYVFISFEASTENWEKQAIIELRLRIVNESYDGAREKSRDDFLDYFRTRFEDYERLLNRVCASGMTSSSLDNQWTFWGALFYSMTVFTTIGYGHLTPITFAGRVATMVYAIFGIPILLMVLADLGKLLTRIIKFAFKKFRYFYNKLLGRKAPVRLRTKQLISDNTTQYIGVARDAFERGFAQYIQPYQNRLPSFGVVRGSASNKVMEAQRRQQQQQQKQPLVMHLSNAERDPQLEASDVIVTPLKQSRPVSPSVQQGDNKRHQKRAHSPGHQSTRRKISNSGKQNSGSESKKSKTSTVSRSSSATNVVEQANKQVAKVTHQMATSAEAVNEKGETVASGQEPALDEKKLAQTTLAATRAAEEQNRSSADQVVIASGAASQNSEFADDEEQEVLGAPDEEEDEDDFDIPVSFALFLLITYMMAGAFVFSIWEGWNFFDALYFVFISMSTIGFGDLVPQHPKRMVGTFAYLLFGLALTSMCINVVQEKIHATFLRAKMQIGEKMGFDLEQIMADDYYGDGGSAFDEDAATGNCELDSIGLSSSSAGHAMAAMDTSAPGDQTPPPADTAAVALQQSPITKSKSRDSLKGSTSGSGSGGRSKAPFPASSRRKSIVGKAKSRQASNSSANTQTVEHVPQQQPQAGPIKAQLETIRMSTIKVGASGQNEQPSINQPVESIRANCEPLRKAFQTFTANENDWQLSGGRTGRIGRATPPPMQQWPPQLQLQQQKPLLPADSGAEASSPLAMSKSLDSSASSFFNRNAFHRRTTAAMNGTNVASDKKLKFDRRNKSLGSTRRASVSHELSQLDDLIVSLSRSPHDRFGPLLGIPAAGSGRPSRSVSPAHNSPRGADHSSTSPNRLRAPMVDCRARETSTSPRARSTTDEQGHKKRSLASQMPPPQGSLSASQFLAMTSNNGHNSRSSLYTQAQLAANQRRKSSSSSTSVAMPSVAPRQPQRAYELSLSESQAALDELEALKFSVETG